MTPSQITPTRPAFDPRVADARDALGEARAWTLGLVAGLSDDTLETVHSTLLSPLVWDLAHIAAFEDLWISRIFSAAPLRPDLMALYDADETPRALRGTLDLLATEGALDYMTAVRARTDEFLDCAEHVDVDRLELVIRHEQQHNETMAQLLQIAHLPCPALERIAAQRRSPERTDQAEFVEIRGGVRTIGADPARGFAYDNEKPRHVIELPAFQIGTRPVGNGDWDAFIADGGYERRELWSEEGWAWRQDQDATRPLHWTDDGREWLLDRQLDRDPRSPVMHVSWHEAEAFANAHEARLPTELEWEAAATLDRDPDTPSGGAETAISGIGRVWEWTSSHFRGYPGFTAYPYREYSEQFFGDGYKVLRGHSWVTRPRVISSSFRNWDLPQRRQIFSGLRLAKEAA